MKELRKQDHWMYYAEVTRLETGRRKVVRRKSRDSSVTASWSHSITHNINVTRLKARHAKITRLETGSREEVDEYKHDNSDSFSGSQYPR